MTTFIDKLFDRTVPALTRSLDLYWKRNEAITSNIANAETPQYQAVDIDFAGELEKAFRPEKMGALKRTNSLHMDLLNEGKSRFVHDYSGMTKADGNNVDIDIQMGRMVYNSGKFSAGASLVRKKLQIMRYAIQQAMR